MVTPSIKIKSFCLLLVAVFTGAVLISKQHHTTIPPFLVPFSQINNHSCSVDFDSILKRGKLIVLTDYNSTGYFIYKGEPMGFEYDLLNDFCKSVGIDLEVVVATNMDSIFYRLNSGEVDLVAANLTVTKNRLEYVDFTKPILYTNQVLVQKKPINWKSLSASALENQLIRTISDLNNKAIHVRKGSSFYERLLNLSNEAGIDINIVLVSGSVETEELIAMVADGVIDYTVADENVAMVNQIYFPDIDTKTALSLPQQIAWAVRKNSGMLLSIINNWMNKYKRNGSFIQTYAKYFKYNRSVIERIESDFFSARGSTISMYDNLIKKYSVEIGWDWKLLASLIYQESRFDNNVVSWAGASGLMQIIPKTAIHYGIDTLYPTPEQSIRAGVRYILRIDNYWKKHISDSAARIPFVLASYNVGLGHVIDARNLALKFNNNANDWNDVSFYLRQKSNSKYFNDPVVKHGYCRGSEPCSYVKEILIRYNHYKNLFTNNQSESVAKK